MAVLTLLDLQHKALEKQIARQILELYVEGDVERADDLLDEIVQRRLEWATQAQP